MQRISSLGVFNARLEQRCVTCKGKATGRDTIRQPAASMPILFISRYNLRVYFLDQTVGNKFKGSSDVHGEEIYRLINQRSNFNPRGV